MRKDNKNGFTLVETLVAIAVLLLAVAAPLSLANKSLNSSALSKQQITASFLAQEAMEYIRNARDENVAQNGNWLTGSGSTNINSCLDKKCQIAVLPKEMTSCSNSCSPLRYNGSTGVYNYNSGVADSIYTRTVEIKKVAVGNNYEITILVTVSWKGTNGADYKVIARENLTNWQ